MFCIPYSWLVPLLLARKSYLKSYEKSTVLCTLCHLTALFQNIDSLAGPEPTEAEEKIFADLLKSVREQKSLFEKQNLRPGIKAKLAEFEKVLTSLESRQSPALAVAA